MVSLVKPIRIFPPAEEVDVVPPSLVATPTVMHPYDNYSKKNFYNKWVHAKEALYSLRDDLGR